MLDAILGAVGLGANLFNASEKRESDEKIAAQNIQNQRDFAQQGIRWKVADATAAGLHPLAALGAQTSSFSNVVGASGDTNDYSEMGQNIGRAIDAGSTKVERQDRMGAALQRTAQVFSLEKMNLENEQLKAQTALTRAQLPPALPGSALAHLSRSPDRTSTGIAVSDDKVEQKRGDIPANYDYKFLGLPLLTDKRASDGQVIEDRLGDFEAVSGLTALYNLIVDGKHTARIRAGHGDSKDRYSNNPFDHLSSRIGPPRPRSPPRTFPYYR